MRLLSKLKYLLPYFILLTLFFILYIELFSPQKKFTSQMIGEMLPDFKLEDLYDPQKTFSSKKLQAQVSLLNVWSSWCYACSLEQPFLLKIKTLYKVPIYGINYKDKRQDALNWLAKYGNPYYQIGKDSQGKVAIELGIYGTPETFLIGPKGQILYRHVGIINQEIWETLLYPLVKQYAS